MNVDTLRNHTQPRKVDYLRIAGAKASDSRLSFISAKLEYEYSNIKVNTKDGIQLVPFSEIACIRSCSNYSIVVSTEGIRYTTCKTLKHWQGEINSQEFVRCHNSYLINRNEIRSINYYDRVVTLKNGCLVKYSRSKRALLVESLQ